MQVCAPEFLFLVNQDFHGKTAMCDILSLFHCERSAAAGVCFLLIVGLLVPMWISPWYCHVVLCAFVAGGHEHFHKLA